MYVPMRYEKKTGYLHLRILRHTHEYTIRRRTVAKISVQDLFIYSSLTSIWA